MSNNESLTRYLTASHTYTFLKLEADKFVPNMTSDENRMEIRRNWDKLMPCEPQSSECLLVDGELIDVIEQWVAEASPSRTGRNILTWENPSSTIPSEQDLFSKLVGPMRFTV